MADRYWVGANNAVWDGSNTANWSTVSGGVGGSSVPTKFDNVFIDSYSGNKVVSILADAGWPSGVEPSCNNLDCTGFAGTINGRSVVTDRGLEFGVYGNLKFSSTMTLQAVITSNDPTSLANIGFYFKSHTGGLTKTITSAGKQFSSIIIGFPWTAESANTTWVLQDALNLAAGLFLDSGTFNTNGYTVTFGDSITVNTYDNTQYRSTLNMSSSLFNGTTGSASWDVSSTGNTVINAGTSSIILYAGNPFSSLQQTIFNGGNKTYNNVTLIPVSNGDTDPRFGIYDINTFNKLTINRKIGVNTVSFQSNQNITTLETNAVVSAPNRVALKSNTKGSPVTLNVSTVSVADVDFMDITAGGSSAKPWTGTRFGNLGGLTNITTATPKNVYWNLSGSRSWSDAGWALTSNGAVGVNNFPLPQDTAYFTDDGSANTVAINSYWNYGNIDASSRTLSVSVDLANRMDIYGSSTNFSGNGVNFNPISVANTVARGVLNFVSNTQQSLSTAGKLMNSRIVCDKYGNTTLTLSSNVVSNSSFTLANGVFSTNTNSITTTLATLTSGNTTVNLSGSTWTVTGNGVAWNTTSALSVVYDSNSAIITTSNAAKSFVGSNKSWPRLTQAGSGALTISGNNTFNAITTSVAPTTITFTSGTTTNVVDWNVKGRAGAYVTLNTTSSTNAILQGPSGRTMYSDYLNINRSTANVSTWYAGKNSVNGGGSLGWIFSNPGNVGSFIVMFK